MTNENENAVIQETMTIDGESYIINDMTAQQQYIVKQLKDLQVKIGNASFALDQAQVASRAFSAALVASTKEKAPADDAVSEPNTE
ncbi:MAG: hypothetical protein ACKVJK_21840 [Methylophagaceae bacterium]|jgi:hypothetical protein|tara:strand:+ start:19 stop:276 length:258 start_codon:yes stop_codon:yes gene_type:complete